MQYYCKCGCYFGSQQELTEHTGVRNPHQPSTSEDDEHKRVMTTEYWAKRKKNYRILQGME